MNLEEILNDMVVFFDKKTCKGNEFAFQGYFQLITKWHNDELTKKDEHIKELEEKLKNIGGE